MSGKAADPGGKLDVLPHILQLYLTATSKDRLPPQFSPLFPVRLGVDYSEFAVDPRVVMTCGLRGSIFYLQCVSTDRDGSPTLRGILHLGNSRGTLNLPKEAEELLQTIAATIADSAADNERVRGDNCLREIRSCLDPTLPNLQGIVSRVKEVCQSIGCTLFLRSTLLQLIGWVRPDQAQFEAAFTRLLTVSSKWCDLLGATHSQRLRSMLAKFLGLTPAGCEALLIAPNRVHVAALLAKSLYIRVARAGEDLSSGRDIAGVVASAGFPKQPLEPFATFVTEECYFPGYGLTGWALRYGYDVLLKDKKPEALRDFYTSSRNIRAPHLSPVIRILKDLSLLSSLEREPIIALEHADHVREQEGHSRPDDTFLACCLESVDDSHFASGVLRTSTSERLPHAFYE